MKRSKFAKRLAYCAVLSSISAIPGLVFAEEAPPEAVSESVFSEIVVTARKREESLQSVPAAVTAITADGLREKNIATFYDLAENAPGLSIRAGSAQRSISEFFIRGQGTTYGSGPGVVTYFADAPAYNATILGNGIQFYDLASVQVLKGPQGTLFGRSTTGGAVLLAPQRPTDKLEGFLEAKIGNLGMKEFTGALNLPLVKDVLSLRLAGNVLRRNGFTVSTTTGEQLDDRHRESYRLGVLFTPAEEFESYTLFYGENVDESSTGARLIAYNPNHPYLNANTTINPLGGFTPADFGAFFAQPVRTAGDAISQLCTGLAIQGAGFGSIPSCVTTRTGRITALTNDLLAERTSFRAGGDDAVRRVPTAFDNFQSGQVQVLVNTTTIRPGTLPMLGDITVKNIFSTGRSIRAASTREISGTRFPHGQPINGQDIVNGVPTITDKSGTTKFFDQYTEEFQIAGSSDRLNWLIGYYREENTAAPNYPPIFPSFNNAFTVPLDSFSPLQQMTISRKDVDIGYFGQVTVKIVEGLNLTAGYRKSKTARDSVTAPLTVTPAGYILTVGGVQTVRSLRENASGYNFSIDWKPMPDLLLYATHRKGFKAGGLNGVPSVIPAGYVPQFKPESLKDVELGVKYSWNAGNVRGRSNIAVYQQWYSDIQRNETLPLPGGGVVTQVNNIAEASLKGFEMENLVQFGRLTLTLNYAYIDAKYKRYPGTITDYLGNTFDRVNTPFTGTPKHQLTLGARVLVVDSPSIGAISFSGDYYRQSSVVLDDEFLADPERLGQVKGYGMLNLRAEWKRALGSPVDLAVFGRNVTDHTHLVGTSNLLNALGTLTGIYNEPRTYGVEARSAGCWCRPDGCDR
ncbi:MAG: TonB-dependent receptor [Actinobacteria bacterium]|nr:TonB-dependent receptor [Actinomycetota bacterium]